MSKRPTNPAPQIKYVEPPPIIWYGISGDQLDRLSDASSQIGYDFSIALAALSVGVTAFLTYLTIPQLTSKQQNIFLVVLTTSVFVFLYTGIRWLVTRNKVANIVEAIRHSDEPESKRE